MDEKALRAEIADSRVTPVRSLYVHAPFCARRCAYCDFAVRVAQVGDLEGWLEALAGELVILEAEGLFRLASSLDTLFVGGGTPSTLGPGAMAGLARVLGPERLRSPALEWTAEANPESFTAEVARAWAAAGVNRISLGAQSFQEEALRWLGRLHGPEGPTRAVTEARKAGIGNISLDLIFGLPGGVERDWSVDLERALALRVPHLSLYGLSVEPGTPLGEAMALGKTAGADEAQYREEFLQANETLASAGYRHYELSNFALPGYECRHNQTYWDYRPYLGLGNSAHSFLPPLRRWNLRDWGEYQDASLRGGRVLEGEEILGPTESRLERIWLWLRTFRGLPLEELSHPGRKMVLSWVEVGWAVQGRSSVVLTPEGWLLLDHLAVQLDRVEAETDRYLDASSGPSRS